MQEGVNSLPPHVGSVHGTQVAVLAAGGDTHWAVSPTILNTQPLNRGIGVWFTVLVVPEKGQLSGMNEEVFWKKLGRPAVNSPLLGLLNAVASLGPFLCWVDWGLALL